MRVSVHDNSLAKMTYRITLSDLNSVTDAEYVFGTERLLPDWEAIPSDFKTGNLYTKLACALFYGDASPNFTMIFLDGFQDEGTPQALNKCVRAHLTSFGPKHEHKIAGVGYMMSCVFEVYTDAIVSNAPAEM